MMATLRSYRLLLVLLCVPLCVPMGAALSGCSNETAVWDPATGSWQTATQCEIAVSELVKGLMATLAVGLLERQQQRAVETADSGNANGVSHVDWDGDGPQPEVGAALTGSWTQSGTSLSVSLAQDPADGDDRVTLSLHMITDEHMAGGIDYVHGGLTYTGSIEMVKDDI